MANIGIDPALYYDFAWGAYGEFGALRYIGDEKFWKSLYEKLERTKKYEQQNKAPELGV